MSWIPAPADFDPRTPVTVMLSPAHAVQLETFLANTREAHPEADESALHDLIFARGLQAVTEESMNAPQHPTAGDEIDAFLIEAGALGMRCKGLKGAAEFVREVTIDDIAIAGAGVHTRALQLLRGRTLHPIVSRFASGIFAPLGIDPAFDADGDEAACREAYDNRYHKIPAEVGYDEWRAIWFKALDYARTAPADTDSEGGEADSFDPAVALGGKRGTYASNSEHGGRDVVAHSVFTPADLHPRTAALVHSFATALAAKLRKAQDKGWSDEWTDKDRIAGQQAELVAHVGKGDPLDVAAFAAFLWFHGARTSLAGYVRGDEFRQMRRRAEDAERTLASERGHRGALRAKLSAAQMQLVGANSQLDALQSKHHNLQADAAMLAAEPVELREQFDAEVRQITEDFEASARLIADGFDADVRRLTEQIEAQRCRSVEDACAVLQEAVTAAGCCVHIDDSASVEVMFGEDDSVHVTPQELPELLEALSVIEQHRPAPSGAPGEE